ncbi:MAG: amidohydrolase [Desulfobacterales bacterium]|nr:MAG: amidohydrolase [Desulfobacterales bacterium]
MEEQLTRILTSCRSHFEEIVAIRRDLHMHPEIGFDVPQTAAIAAAALEELGIRTKTGIGKTGVVGDLEVGGAAKRIALRADMDALPMQEIGPKAYKSKIDGKAHMCGHDVHTAILIGAARVIRELKSALAANIRFIFQPNEESSPPGAAAMIADGVLEGVDEIYGLHVWPLLEAGQYGICPDIALARSDCFEVEIKGQGGHGAEPHLAIDPVLIGCQFVTMLQSIVARNVDPREKAVVSVTQIQGGTAFNIIPDRVRIRGTVRTMSAPILQTIQGRLETMLAGITAAHGATYRLAYEEVAPATYNHKQCVDTVLAVAAQLVGPDNVVFPYPPDLGSEDFAYYSHKVPAGYIQLGCGNQARGIVQMCHHPGFDVDEDCIFHGMALFAALALGV